jgi:putative Holliday junction resolvase
LQYSRKMGLDFGEARIGIALSDLLGVIANPYQTYARVSLEQDVAHIATLCKEQLVDTVVFGLPLQMDGTEGATAQKVREFANLLQPHINAKIVFVDERLTSVEAEEILAKRNMKWQDRKKLIDQVAAQIILQQYLERRI